MLFFFIPNILVFQPPSLSCDLDSSVRNLGKNSPSCTPSLLPLSLNIEVTKTFRAELWARRIPQWLKIKHQWLWMVTGSVTRLHSSTSRRWTQHSRATDRKQNQCLKFLKLNSKTTQQAMLDVWDNVTHCWGLKSVIFVTRVNISLPFPKLCFISDFC